MGLHLWDKDSKEVSKLTLSQMTQQIYEPSLALHNLKVKRDLMPLNTILFTCEGFLYFGSVGLDLATS